MKRTLRAMTTTSAADLVALTASEVEAVEALEAIFEEVEGVAKATLF